MFEKPKYYQDCSELKVATFFKILKTQDLRLLCYYGKPKQKVLDEIWSNIQEEYEKLTAGVKYCRQISESNEECLEVIRNNGLILLYFKKKLQPDGDHSADEKYWDVEGCDADEIYKIILRERTRHEIKKLQEEERKELKDKGQEKITFERHKHYVEDMNNRDHIDLEKVSVAEWIDFCHSANERAEALYNKS